MKNPKYIIIEGTDNVGKDTQIKQIIKRYPEETFHVLHYSSLPFGNDLGLHIEYSKRLYSDMFQIMIENLNNEDRNLIFNRSHLGESVYSNLYRKYNGNYVFEIEESYVNILKEHLYLIVLVGDPNLIIKRDDGLSFYKDSEGVNKEIELFTKSFNKSNIINKILINIGSKDIDEVSNEIYNFLK